MRFVEFIMAGNGDRIPVSINPARVIRFGPAWEKDRYGEQTNELSKGYTYVILTGGGGTLVLAHSYQEVIDMLEDK